MRIAHILIPCSIFIAGCGSSAGQLGHAQFAWNGCLTGCAINENPLAAGGARDEIALTLQPGYSVASVTSSNGKVAAFTLNGPLLVGVVSGAPGSAKLQLVDAAGGIVDEVDVDVVATAKLAVDDIWGSGAAIVFAGAALPYHVTTEDANGHMLRGTGAVTFSVSGAVQITPGITIGDEVFVTGTSDGVGSIVAQAGSVSVTQPLTIAGADRLTSLVATAAAGQTQSDGSFAQKVDVIADTSDGAVYGAACQWTTSDPSVVIGATVGELVAGQPAQATTFELTLPGSFTATCQIGAQSATIPLKR